MNKKMLGLFIKFSYGSIVAAAISFITTMITTRFFEPQYFGILSIFTSITSISMVVITLGTDQALIRFFNEENEKIRVKLLIRTMKFPLILLVLVSGITFLFINEISIWIFETNNHLLVGLLIVNVFFELIFRYTVLFIRMKQRANLYSILQIVHKLIYIIAILLLYQLMSDKIIILTLGLVIAVVTSTVISILSDSKSWKNLNETENLKTSSLVIIKYSMPFMFALGMTIAFESIDKFFIKEYHGYYELGLYSAAFKIVSLAGIVQSMISAFLVPIYFDHYEKNPDDKRFFRMMSSLVIIVMLIIGVGVIGFKDILVMLLASEYALASTMIPFLVFFPVFYTISEAMVIGINFKKKTQYHMIVAVVALIVSLVSNFFLVPLLGGLGAAISTGATFLFFLGTRIYLSNLLYKVDYRLFKLVIVTILFISFATAGIFIDNILINMMMMVVMILLIVTIYFKDIKEIINEFLSNNEKRGEENER